MIHMTVTPGIASTQAWDLEMWGQILEGYSTLFHQEGVVQKKKGDSTAFLKGPAPSVLQQPALWPPLKSMIRSPNGLELGHHKIYRESEVYLRRENKR